MIDHLQLLVHVAGQAMQHVGEADGGDGRRVEGKWRKQVDPMQLGLEAGEPLPRAVETLPVRIEQHEALELYRRGTIEQKPGSDARLEML